MENNNNEKKPEQTAKPKMSFLKNGFCNIQLTEEEIKALMTLLQFAGSAAGVIAQQELSKGQATSTAVLKMKGYMNDSQVLMDIIAANMNIGEPEPDQIH